MHVKLPVICLLFFLVDRLRRGIASALMQRKASPGWHGQRS
jgi:hypothetical protein